MKYSRLSDTFSQDEQEEDLEKAALLTTGLSATTRTSPGFLSRITFFFDWLWLSVALNVLLAAGVLTLCLRLDKGCGSVHGVWSPANGAIEYIQKQAFRGALFNETEYMGFPTDETDRLWSELYNFGISKITEEEAMLLPSPTLPIPGTKDFLIELDVWHELHCLNDLRKILYPERYPGLDSMTEHGVINRNNDMFRHWDHCIDSLRQALMCHADVSPISFHVNVPVSTGVFPRLATTHTCRNFSKIQDWARQRSAGEWNYTLTSEQASGIIKTAGFDQSPFEDIEFMWELFPDNKFFKHWRDEAKKTV